MDRTGELLIENLEEMVTRNISKVAARNGSQMSNSQSDSYLTYM